MTLNVGLFTRVCAQNLTTGNQLFVLKLCYFLCAVSICSKKKFIHLVLHYYLLFNFLNICAIVFSYLV